jgi:16S rRNA C1402 (ribose-2'-O) methylase RsmI
MRELTKLHEEIYHDTALNLLEKFSENMLSGEITMIIGTPISHGIKMNNFDKQIIELSKKHSASEIVNIIRLFNDVNKKELYKYVLKIRQSG